MSYNQKKDPVEEQRRKQKELLELKRKKQEFENNPEAFVPEGPSEVLEQDAKSKLSNFWYYSRFSIIMILIVAAILVIGITQCTQRPKYDATVVVYFKQYLSSAMIENIGIIAEQYCEDYNGDGEVNVLVMDCAIPDDERMLETGQAKSTRLMAQFASEEAIIYIVDKEALSELDTIAGGVFVDDSLGLPSYEGKAYALNGTVFDKAFDVAYEDYAKEFEYYVIRRVVKGTQIEDRKDVNIHSERANEIIGKIVENPQLEGVELELVSLKLSD